MTPAKSVETIRVKLLSETFDGTPAFDAILNKLESLGPIRFQAKHVRTKCPMHGGDDPTSFVLFPSGVGYCHSGCNRSFSSAEIAEKLNVNLPHADGLSVDEFLKAFGLPDWIRDEFGLRTSSYGGRTFVIIPYMDESGELLRNRKRLRLHGGQKHEWQGSGGRAYPFGLQRLKEIKQIGRVLIVEGETDVLACAAGHIPAIGIPGANMWREEYRRYFEGIEVAIWQEPGDAGRGFVDSIGIDLPLAKILRHPRAKDPAELWLLSGDEEFKQEIERQWNSAAIFTDLKSAEVEREREQLEPLVRELLDDPALIERLSKDITASGYIGDIAPVLACYIGLTSRVLERPMNLMLIAQSAAGKNFAVSTALLFFPDSSYQKVDAGSPGSFVYDETPLKHKGFVLTEFDSAPQGDGVFASAMRTLFEESRLVYKTTIEENGKRRAIDIVREGPMAVITTAVKTPEIQSDTRLLPVPVLDTKEQVKAIARGTALKAQRRDKGPEINFELYKDFQCYLDLGGPYEVIIPFASALEEAMPDEVAGAPRWNRDLPQLLTAIRSVAIINKVRRRHDGELIIAELEDYGIVRKAFEPSFRAAASQGLTDADRKAYAAIKELPGMNNTALAEKLGVSQSSASYRSSKLQKTGRVVNTAANNKVKLEIAAPLPDEVSLPSLESVSDQLESDSNLRIAAKTAPQYRSGFEDSDANEGNDQTDWGVL